MGSEGFISYNGKIIHKDELKLDLNNRAFQYGDGLFETMHASGNKVQFFYEHMERLIRSMKVLKMEIPVRFTIDTMGLQKEISKILNKNKLFKGARIRMTVFRETGGFYSPESNETEYIIESSPLTSDVYEFNQKGLLIDIYEEQLKPINSLASVKLTSSIFFVLAGIFKKENNLDECLILNTKGNIIEGISSNIFLVRENVISTPALREGCLPGIMRQKIIELARKNRFIVQDEQAIKIQDIMAADEIFSQMLLKVYNGLLVFKQRRFYN
ncbi:MAG: aminotransferase class IV, partial [Chloroflexia bacterium]|nr:aminotransferase class IV [Chloroflexia bacterium]